LKTPWDFDSWIDAIEDAEISYEELDVNGNGVGKLVFKQLAWPSGGIEATEQIIKVFDGVIEANDAM